MQVILTSYDVVRVDAASLAALHPHAVILDEVHKLKNAKSKQYEAAMQLPTKYRYGLSGAHMVYSHMLQLQAVQVLC